MEGWGPNRHNGRGPAWPAPQRSVVLVSSILQTLLPFKAPGNGQFLPTRKCEPAVQFIDNSKLSLLTRSPRFFQRGIIVMAMDLFEFSLPGSPATGNQLQTQPE